MIKVKGILKILAVPVGFLLSGCVSSDEEMDFSNIKPCEIYNSAIEDFNDKAYHLTNEQLASLDANFPFSNVMDSSLFLAGKSFFLNDKFMDATEKFKQFLKLYPKHDRVVEAEYMLAMSYWYLSGTLSRDITFLKMAKMEMKKFIKKHPKNVNSESFKKKISAIDNSFAKKEVDTAVYLLKDNDYSAAINRLQIVLAKYEKTDLIPEVLYRLVEGYSSLNLMEDAEFFKDKLKKEYPNSSWNNELKKWFKKIDKIESRNKKD